MDVADRIREKDKFGEALPHLDDKAYERAKKAYDSIFSLQYRHNQLVSDAVGNLESSITPILSRCHIPDNGHEYYSLAHIIQALKDASASHQSQLNENQQMVNGVSYIDFTLAGITFARSRTDKGNAVRQLIESKLSESAQNMSKIQKYIQDMKLLLDNFNTEIEKIIHEADRSGLKGRCILETRPWKFFRSKSYSVDD
jgi:hypothetical protein